MNDQQKRDFINRVADAFEERDLDRLDRRLYYAMRDSEWDLDRDPLYRVAVEVAKDWGIEV